MEIDISVVVPFYNAERFIEGCINALLSQSYPTDRYEIIMVDNNSTDGSAGIAERYSRAKLLLERKQGAYAARNRGIAEAKGAIIAFTDPDCLPAVDWLKNMRAAMLCPDVGIVLGSRQFASNSLGLSMLIAYESEKAAYVSSGNTREICYGYTNNMGVRRSLFGRLGPFLEIARGADTIFVRRAVDEYSCDVVYYSPRVCVRHLQITSVWDFYWKQLVYGRSNQNNHKVASFRPLSITKRLQLFKRTIQKSRYSLVESALLFLLLCVGGVCYETGRWRAIWNLRHERRLS